MKHYKLTYFDGRGRGEVCRLLFALAGVDYEDNRIGVSIPPESSQLYIWTELKQKTPFGKLPLLEIDGKVIAQSHAIERYLARVYGFCGSNDFEMALTDMWIESFEEIIVPIIQYNFHLVTEEEKTEKKRIYLQSTLPLYFKKLEEDLKASTTGYLVGSSLTVADLYVLRHNEWMLASFGEEGRAAVQPYPKIQQHIKFISALPKIQSWLEKRPKTKF